MVVKLVFIIALIMFPTKGQSGAMSIFKQIFKILPRTTKLPSRTWTSLGNANKHFLKRLNELKKGDPSIKITSSEWKRIINFSYVRVLEEGKGVIFKDSIRRVYILIDPDYRRKIIVSYKLKIISTTLFSGVNRTLKKLESNYTKIGISIPKLEPGLETPIPF